MVDPNWKTRPTLIEYWPDNVDYIMGMDENGSSDLVSIKRKIMSKNPIDPEIKDFTLTGVILNKSRYEKLRLDMNKLKFEFWDNGVCLYKDTYKRVCFHSLEIRKRVYPFNSINYSQFMSSLSSMIAETNAKIISCYIDKEKHFRKYSKPDHPYHIAVRFIMERYSQGLNEGNKKGIIILESRGEKEDKFVLDHIVEILENGTNQNPANHFSNIVGVYFNPKWWANDNNQSTFVILELADLVSFPIHKYARNNCKDEFKDQAFCIIEQKLYKFPKYNGWGLKIWAP